MMATTRHWRRFAKKTSQQNNQNRRWTKRIRRQLHPWLLERFPIICRSLSSAMVALGNFIKRAIKWFASMVAKLTSEIGHEHA